MEREINDGVTEIGAALNFITGSIEYQYLRGIGDHETCDALNEAFAEFHRLDPIVRARAKADEMVEWEKLMGLVEEKEQVFREIERGRESQESQA